MSIYVRSCHVWLQKGLPDALLCQAHSVQGLVLLSASRMTSVKFLRVIRLSPPGTRLWGRDLHKWCLLVVGVCVNGSWESTLMREWGKQSRKVAKGDLWQSCDRRVSWPHKSLWSWVDPLEMFWIQVRWRSFVLTYWYFSRLGHSRGDPTMSICNTVRWP
jgi:hypothetical protein